MINLNRSAGILLPITSLPSKYGIGTFGKEAYDFIDFLKSAKQQYWQLLPQGPISYGDSPYSAFSIYAGNPLYIDLEYFIDDGILSANDCHILDTNYEYINYEMQFNYRYDILHKVYINSKEKYKENIKKFTEKNNWVLDYSLFMSLKYYFNQKPWYEFPKNISNRDKRTLDKYKLLLEDEINFWIFLQFVFYEQYFNLKDYANNKGIKIIGDMPIYVAEDSVEAWGYKELFILNEKNNISLVAGVPPDDFSDEGQLWGNPVYDWEYHDKTSYQWWIDRISWNLHLYDLVRIDHFRGFDEFWAVPSGSENAINGEWMPAKGKPMFETLTEKVEEPNIIAEDLGIITDSVLDLKKKFNFPGMKVLQFAFDGNPKNPYLPKNYEENSIAYTGTHDNDTLKGWYHKLSDNSKRYVLEILNIELNIEDEDVIIEQLIEAVLKGREKIAIIPLQDYLCLGSQSRINTPSTLGHNWSWRVGKESLTQELAEKIGAIIDSSGRVER